MEIRSRVVVRRTLLIALLGMLQTSCGSDARTPLEECSHGLYWADCGGGGVPVLGCDESTGACRWFRGGVSARGYAVSDCPAEEVCCHSGWPFSDFTPDGDLRRRVADQLGYIVEEPAMREGASIPVLFDLTEPTVSGRIQCSGAPPVQGCAAQSLGTPAMLRREGASVVVTLGRESRLELEIITGTVWTARLYQVVERNPHDAEPRLLCRDLSVGGELPISGTLHLSSDAVEDLGRLHGRLDGQYGEASFSVEF